MRSTRLVLAAIVLFPIAAAAQGGASSGRGLRVEQKPELPKLKAGQLEELNPARIVEKRKKEISLDASQLSRVVEIRSNLDADANRLADEVNKSQKVIAAAPPNLKLPPEGTPQTRKDSVEKTRLDSLNRVKWDAYVQSVTDARSKLAASLLQLKTSYDAAVQMTLALLNDQQRPMVAQSIDAAGAEFTYRLRNANIR